MRSPEHCSSPLCDLALVQSGCRITATAPRETSITGEGFALELPRRAAEGAAPPGLSKIPSFRVVTGRREVLSFVLDEMGAEQTVLPSQRAVGQQRALVASAPH